MPYPEDHARAVNIGDLQLAQFGHPQARGIEGGEDGAVFEVGQRCQYGRDFGLAEDGGQREGAAGMRDILNHARALERDTIEEAQGTDGLHDGGPGQLLLLDQKELIGADLLRAKVLGGGRKMLAKSATQCR